MIEFTFIPYLDRSFGFFFIVEYMVEELPANNKDRFYISFLQIIITIFCLITSTVFMQFSMMSALYYSRLPDDFKDSYSAMSSTEKEKVQKSLSESLAQEVKTEPEKLTMEYYGLVIRKYPFILVINSIFWAISFLLPAYIFFGRYLKAPGAELGAELSFQTVSRGLLAGAFTFAVVSLFSVIFYLFDYKPHVGDFQKILFREMKGNVSLFAWSVYSVGMLTGIFEELYFRGYLLTHFVRSGNARFGLFFTSVLFGLMHYSFGVSAFVPFITAVVGYFFASFYLFTGNIWISASAHAAYNSLGLLTAFLLGDRLL